MALFVAKIWIPLSKKIKENGKFAHFIYLYILEKAPPPKKNPFFGEISPKCGWVAGVSGKGFFGSQEREGKLKITFPFYGKGTGIRKCYGKGREWEN